MKHIYLLFAVLILAACSKDKFDPSNPKNGQKVELVLDHYIDARDQRVLLLPQKESSHMSISGFEERELGYTYKVKAKVYVSPQVVMDDGANSWFEFLEVISKEKYTGDQPFEINLVHSIGFGSGGNLAIKKEDDQFKYGRYDLRFINEKDKQHLDDLLLREKGIENAEQFKAHQEYLGKMALKAVVTHDPQNWGKGYLVRTLKFNE